MSIIVWTPKIMAADSAAYDNGHLHRLTKIDHVRGRGMSGVFAWCGNVTLARHVASMLAERLPGPEPMKPLFSKDDFPEIGVLIASVDGTKATFSNGGAPVDVTQNGFFLDGSPVACGLVRAFLHSGMDAHDAVAAAIETGYSDSIAGPVRFVDFTDSDLHIGRLETTRDVPIYSPS